MKATQRATPSLQMVNLGCSKNQVDAESMLGEWVAAGFRIAKSGTKANVIVVNTCGFIDAAKEESIDTILGIVQSKAPDQRLVVAGCLSQRFGDELRKEIPEADVMFGTYQPGQLLDALGYAQEADHCRGAQSPSRVAIDSIPHHSFLKIAEGCNRGCAFCAIPGIRGRQRSRNVADLVQEAQRLSSAGVKEVSLIAQDLTYYGREKGGPGKDLETLLRQLLDHTDLHWIRLMYAYPAFLTDGLLSLLANEPRLCHYLDMPIQHASDQVLRNMRRGYGAESLREQLRRLRSSIHGLTLRTTVLVGYPGETDDDYAQLLDLVDEIRFERLGGFTYSEENGTESAGMNLPRVPSELAQERLERLLALQSEISLEKNQSRVGQQCEVVIDSVADESEFHFWARTAQDAPEVDNLVRITEGSALPGEFRQARIIDATEFELDAVLL